VELFAGIRQRCGRAGELGRVPVLEPREAIDGLRPLLAILLFWFCIARGPVCNLPEIVLIAWNMNCCVALSSYGCDRSDLGQELARCRP
jgi:hypothetical protein